MGIKEQFKKLKENWFLVVLILAVLIVPIVINSFDGDYNSSYYYPSAKGGYDLGLSPSAGVGYDSQYSSSSSRNFAPEVTERKITSSATLNSVVEKGEFKTAELKLKEIIISSEAYLLNENSNLYGQDKYAYYSGYYLIKVESSKYQAVLSQLKELGEVTSFTENSQDITGSYTNTKLELEAEKTRLSRYLEMYKEATNVNDKINLNDRIFEQERKIKYMEDSLQNMEQKVEYYTISLNLDEEQSEYLNIIWVRFSELIENLVQSFNSLLKFIFMALPYALLALIIWIGYRIVKKRR